MEVKKQKNLTGSWRTYKPVVNLEKCTGCKICYNVCPDSCIKIKEIPIRIKGKTEKKLKSTINYEYCKGCGLCSKECPFKAIEMIKEEKIRRENE